MPEGTRPKKPIEVVELCHLSSAQARDLLARMVRKGLIDLQGSKKSSHYTLSAKYMDSIHNDMYKSIKSKKRGPLPPKPP
jgi:hypothetical protein